MEIRSDTTHSGLLALGCALAGLLFLVLTGNGTDASPDARAAFWLGVLLLALGVGAAVALERVVLRVEPGSRRIVVHRRTWFGERVRILPFRDVVRVGVLAGSSGTRRPTSYFLVLGLRDGGTLRTGRWSHDRQELDALAAELAAMLGCPCDPPGFPALPPTLIQALLAAAGGVLGYALWYRATVGAWCPAMWAGTAPPVIILTLFAVLLGLARRFSRPS